MAMQLAAREQGTSNIQTFSNGCVLVDYGPMRMFISVFEDGKSLVTLAREGAHLAIRVLEDLAGFLPVIKKKAQGLEVEKKFADVVRRMIEATQRMEEPDLTPLAAVAGAIALGAQRQHPARVSRPAGSAAGRASGAGALERRCAGEHARRGVQRL